MIYKGSQKQGNIYKGGIKIGKIYKGSQLVYQSGIPVYVGVNGTARVLIFGEYSTNGLCQNGYTGSSTGFKIDQLSGTVGSGNSSVQVTDGFSRQYTLNYYQTVICGSSRLFLYKFETSQQQKYIVMLSEKSQTNTYCFPLCWDNYTVRIYPTSVNGNTIVSWMIYQDVTFTRDYSLDFQWDGVSNISI